MVVEVVVVVVLVVVVAAAGAPTPVPIIAMAIAPKLGRAYRKIFRNFIKGNTDTSRNNFFRY